MANYEKGFKFEVVNNGLYGIINSFYDDPVVKRKCIQFLFMKQTEGIT